MKALAVARLARAAGGTALVTALRWHVYEISGEESALGWLGLVEFLPVIPLGLVAGALVDATDRVRVAALSQFGFALAAFALALGADSGLPVLLACAFASAVCGAFEFPAVATILPNLVPRAIFPSAVSLVATSRNLGWTLGPLLGGAGLEWLGVSGTFAAAGGVVALSAIAITTLPRAQAPSERREVSLRAIREGIAFVRAEKPVLGAMTLDLFAVLFAGATALLPVYAKALDASGIEYGVLTAAMTIGTFLMSALLMIRPPMAWPGRALLGAVAVFGLATLAFGFSRWFPLSVLALIVAGMADEVSMVARSTIIQLGTPDALRGRVSAVNAIFVGASNELGAAESGFLAAATSATFSVVFGGVACLGVLAIVARKLPQLARFRVAAALALALLSAGTLGVAGAGAETDTRNQAAPPPAAASLFAPHHGEDGYFVPWGADESRGLGGFLRWQFSRNRYGELPRKPAPRVANDGAALARPLAPGEAELTWVGHATFAVHDGADVFLTDPHFGTRALLPPRLVPPGVPLDGDSARRLRRDLAQSLRPPRCFHRRSAAGEFRLVRADRSRRLVPRARAQERGRARLVAEREARPLHAHVRAFAALVETHRARHQRIALVRLADRFRRAQIFLRRRYRLLPRLCRNRSPLRSDRCRRCSRSAPTSRAGSWISSTWIRRRRSARSASSARARCFRCTGARSI